MVCYLIFLLNGCMLLEYNLYLNKIFRSEFSTCVEEIHNVKLPGFFKVGEAKPSNQNHAIIFMKGEAQQAVDMNMDHSLEEAMKFPALVTLNSYGTILGFREHVYTAEVSLMAKLMAYMELVS